MDKLAKSQAVVEALQKRLGEQQVAKAKAEERLVSLKIAWGDLAEGTNNDKAMAANEAQQSKLESEIKRATRRIEGVRKRLPGATGDLALAQHHEDIAELQRLQKQSVQVYADFRGRALELLAVGGHLDEIEREMGGLKLKTDAYARHHGLPPVSVRPRSAFDVGVNMVKRYGTQEGMARFLRMLRNDERILGWQD